MTVANRGKCLAYLVIHDDVISGQPLIVDIVLASGKNIDGLAPFHKINPIYILLLTSAKSQLKFLSFPCHSASKIQIQWVLVTTHHSSFNFIAFDMHVMNGGMSKYS